METPTGSAAVKSYVFRVVIEDDAMETGEKAYHAYCPALKGCHTWGRTYDEALANVREAVELYVDDLAVAVNLCAYERRATWRDRPPAHSERSTRTDSSW
jgi:predicted RNase H-like HicB family nuclease